jgi:hypothetical protein
MAEPVDDMVSRILVERLSQPDAQLLLHGRTGQVDVAGLQDRANALRGRLDELSTLFAAGDITGRQLATATTSVRAQLDQVDAELATAVAGTPLAGFSDAEDVATAWENASISRRKAVIRTLMRVTLLKAPRGRQPDGTYFDPDCVKIEWTGAL